MKPTSLLHPLWMTITALALASSIQAAQLCDKKVVPPTATDWGTPTSAEYPRYVPLKQFDPALGELTSIVITVKGTLLGTIGVENTSPESGSHAKATLAANLNLCCPVGSVLIEMMLAESDEADLGVFDGVIDFEGTSGKTWADLGGVETATHTLTDPASFACYIGTGEALFAAKAEGKSTVMAGGNEVNSIQTVAGIEVEICYNYAPPGDEGCTPGYWKNHLRAWGPTGFKPTDDFDTVFGVNAFNPDLNLMQAVNLGGGGLKALARHAVAALLNASHPDVESPMTPSEVIAAVQGAVATMNYERADRKSVV